VTGDWLLVTGYWLLVTGKKVKIQSFLCVLLTLGLVSRLRDAFVVKFQKSVERRGSFLSYSDL
jgi:hypothetical protein